MNDEQPISAYELFLIRREERKQLLGPARYNTIQPLILSDYNPYETDVAYIADRLRIYAEKYEARRISEIIK